MKYMVIRADAVSKLVEDVQFYIDKYGYEPIGGITVVPSTYSGPEFLQAMVKK